MKKKITAPHLRIYNTLEDDINSQMDSLAMDFDGLIAVNLILHHQNNMFRARLVVNGRKFHITADAKGDLLSTVIDAVFAKAERQIRKHHDKRNSHRRQKGVSEIERYLRDKQYESEVA